MSKQKTIQPFIDESYLDMVPRPTSSERTALKQSIKDEGQLVPIVINSKGKVLDGHTRFQICDELGINPTYTIEDFIDPADEKEYVILTNLKRRHLIPFQIAIIIDDLRDKWKKEANEKRKKLLSDIKKGKRLKLTREERLKNNVHLKIAAICGISGATIQKIDYIRRHGTQDDIYNIINGTTNTTLVYNRLKNYRHKTNAPNIRNTIVYPDCEECGGTTRKKGNCHVHKSYCCKVCVWGN